MNTKFSLHSFWYISSIYVVQVRAKTGSFPVHVVFNEGYVNALYIYDNCNFVVFRYP